MSNSFYWYAKTTSDEWVVMWSPGEPWHRIVATFHDEGRARAYVDVENSFVDLDEHHGDTSEAPPKLLPPPTRLNGNPSCVDSFEPAFRKDAPSNKTSGLFIDSLAVRFRDHADEIFGEYPDGVTVKDLRKMFDLKYDYCTALARKLDSMGVAQWVYQPDDSGHRRRCKVLLPNSVDIRESELTDRQARILRAISEASDHRCMAQISNADIAKNAGVGEGISDALWVLQTRGFLMMATPSLNNQPAVYQVLREHCV